MSLWYFAVFPVKMKRKVFFGARKEQHNPRKDNGMLKIKNYVKVKSVAEAYELNQKRTACVVGGMVWLKMGNRNVSTAIDLSGLGLDTIRETEEEFVIGCMTPLRELEMNPVLDAFSHGAIRESLRHIVGVQFRNCATVGGSIYGRYGFSDVLTMLLAMDTWVELYHGGRIPLAEFAAMKKDRDILEHIIIKKTPLFCAYFSQRNTETDFPVLTCAASLVGEEARTVIGARPGRAVIVEDTDGILKGFKEMTNKQRAAAIQKFADYAARKTPVGGNMRGSAQYRTHLVKILTRRAWEAVGGMKNEY